MKEDIKPFLSTKESKIDLKSYTIASSIIKFPSVYHYLIDVIFLFKNGMINRAKYKSMLKRLKYNNNSIYLTEFNKNLYHCKIIGQWLDKYECKDYYKILHNEWNAFKEYDNFRCKVVTGSDIFKAIKIACPIKDALICIVINNLYDDLLHTCFSSINMYNVDSLNSFLSLAFGKKQIIRYVNYEPEIPYVWDYEADRDGQENYNWVSYLNAVLYKQRISYEKVIHG